MVSAVAIDGLDDGSVVFEWFGDGEPCSVVGGASGGGERDGTETEDALADGLDDGDVLNMVEGCLKMFAAEDT